MHSMLPLLSPNWHFVAPWRRRIGSTFANGPILTAVFDAFDPVQLLGQTSTTDPK